MSRIIALILALQLSVIGCAADYDVVIVGGTPGGIMTAISAARQGKTALLLERTSHIGGLPANGLGATDIATRGATTGLFREFTQRVRQYYIDRYGDNSSQVKDCSDGFHFEPSVAETVFTEMLAEHADKIKIHTMRQFDSEQGNVEMTDSIISSIVVLNRTTGKRERYHGKIFVDATYEGDLGAAAGVPFRVGREPASMYNEPGAGKVYEYWKSLPAEGTTGVGDDAVQAYNYRLCLTDRRDSMIPVRKPSNYNRDEYVSLIDDVWSGRNTLRVMRNVTDSMMAGNRRHIAAGGLTQIPGDSWGIRKLSSMVRLPNGKTDANNQHGAFISTDLPEENWGWPTATWEWRDAFAARLKDYTLGLLWFACNDSELPPHFRDAVSAWGFAKDEYTDNDNFPRQVY
ncbi:MAG: FAD-dependent oxidoreductase, partial [Duncaniella sp.]|nr:FAD-dependent oxidoreductase [Duncaniella sp.]